MLHHRTLLTALAVLTLATTAAPARAEHLDPPPGNVIAYWSGTATIADPRLDCPNGQAGVTCQTLYYQQVIYPQADQLFVKGACPVVLNFVGLWPAPGDPYVELPGELVYATFIDTYTGGARFSPSSSPTCFILLAPGHCMHVSGVRLLAPDLFGRTYIATDLSPC